MPQPARHSARAQEGLMADEDTKEGIAKLNSAIPKDIGKVGGVRGGLADTGDDTPEPPARPDHAVIGGDSEVPLDDTPKP